MALTHPLLLFHWKQTLIVFVFGFKCKYCLNLTLTKWLELCLTIEKMVAVTTSMSRTAKTFQQHVVTLYFQWQTCLEFRLRNMQNVLDQYWDFTFGHGVWCTQFRPITQSHSGCYIFRFLCSLCLTWLVPVASHSGIRWNRIILTPVRKQW